MTTRPATDNVEIRAAGPRDAAALQRLAALDSARGVPAGPVVVALVAGEAIAAVGADGSAIADPFRHTADLVGFLRTAGARKLAPASGPAEVTPLRARRALRRLALAG
ncbi:MAG: hypothetical protein U0T02_09315 [Solirubrobacteraceae bacterium]